MKQQQQETLMRSTNSEFEWTDDRIRNCGNSGQKGTRQQRSAGGWASRRMPSSERRTVSICRHAHRRSEPASRHVRRVRRAGRPSRSLRIPCLSRALRDGDIPTPVERIAPTVAPTRHVAIAQRRIGSHPCCWPIGEPGTPAFRFCDDPAPLDVPYCDEHARRAYKPRRRRDATDEILLAQLQ